MVDNELPGPRKADDVQKETLLASCSSPSAAFSQRQTVRLCTTATAVEDDGPGDAAIGREHDKSVCAPSADTSDVLRQIVIDGSNIAMRFGFIYLGLRGFLLFGRYIIDKG